MEWKRDGVMDGKSGETVEEDTGKGESDWETGIRLTEWNGKLIPRTTLKKNEIRLISQSVIYFYNITNINIRTTKFTKLCG